ncbi:MAG: Mrp/NBP35 family ATP-binding protein [Bdellovibrionaceae bacterium]|nr:Mrp/NBP35 family ATP-binding protein [Pseudobdellovibrionaceae bacterium]MDW8190988.1 Mrp/NBP35 family ATP-binding protein [Pseudobdellovibrionaceae bacterium]
MSASTTTNPFHQQKPIPGVKTILAVSSGKGGVGKSTVAVNLASALAQTWNVGLLDADIHGPSVPRMTGTLAEKPNLSVAQKLVPIRRWGMQILSIGHLVDEDSAVIWRGPMLFKALDQFFFDVAWDNLDILVIDLPPGTGDVQLTLAQKIPVTGAICVGTPQNVALADVKKSIDMWKRVGVKVLGVVENMAFFVHPDTGETLDLFPRGDLLGYLDQMKIPLLAKIPFCPQLAKLCEAGIPSPEVGSSIPPSNRQEKEPAQIFRELALKIGAALSLSTPSSTCAAD